MNIDNQQISEIIGNSPNVGAQNMQSEIMPNVQNVSKQVYPSQDELKKQATESLAQDIAKIDNAMKKGLITTQIGLSLLCERVNKAKQQITQESVSPIGYLQENELFKDGNYSEVLNYLQGSNANFDAGEISKISELIKLVEQKAVDRYSREKTYEKQFETENRLAKEKMSLNAQNREGTEFSNPIYTRESIGKMSSADFVKNEKAIMEQLKRGLIR